MLSPACDSSIASDGAALRRTRGYRPEGGVGPLSGGPPMDLR